MRRIKLSPQGPPVPRPRRDVPPKHKAVCERRGYCGPFVNERRGDEVGSSAWLGEADCVRCRRAVRLGEELLKWEAALYRARFGVDLPETPPSRPASRRGGSSTGSGCSGCSP